MAADSANLTGYSARRELTVGSPLPWVVALQLSDSQVEVDESVTCSGSVKSASGSPAAAR